MVGNNNRCVKDKKQQACLSQSIATVRRQGEASWLFVAASVILCPLWEVQTCVADENRKSAFGSHNQMLVRKRHSGVPGWQRSWRMLPRLLQIHLSICQELHSDRNYCLTVVEARMPKSRCWQSYSDRSRGRFSCLFQLLVSAGNLWHLLACRCISPVTWPSLPEAPISQLHH